MANKIPRHIITAGIGPVTIRMPNIALDGCWTLLGMYPVRSKTNNPKGMASEEAIFWESEIRL